MNPKTKGYILGAIASATYGMNPMFAIPLYDAGMNADSVLFFRYLFALPMMGMMLLARGHDFKVSFKELITLVIMGLLFSLSSLTLFESYHHMDTGIASTLLFVYPIMVSVIMAIFFKEKMTLQTGFCMAMALGGIALLCKTGGNQPMTLTGILLIMTSALSYAIYIVSVNRPILKKVPTLKVTFYVILFGLSLYAVRLGVNRNLVLPTAVADWGRLVCLALFPTVISLLCTTTAILYIGSTTTAILGALEPVAAIVLGVTILGERLGLRDVVGVLFIIVAVTVIVAGGRMSKYFVRLRRLFPRGGKQE